MNLPKSHPHIERFIALLVIATALLVVSLSAYDADPSSAPTIIFLLSVLGAVLVIAVIELIKQRNIQADAARAANYRCTLFEKRASSLGDENKRLFNAYLSHLPVKVIIRTLAEMGGGPIRIRDFGPETEWFKVATSTGYRHLFDQEDLRKLEEEARNRKDESR